MRYALLVVCAVLVFVPQGAYAASFEVSGWLPYWRAATSTATARAHLDQLTEINPFGYTITSDGKLKDLMGVSDEPWASLIQEAKAKKVRVVPTIMWSDGAAIHRILSNYDTRVQLEDEILALVTEKGYDGIDIDFENKWAETRDYYSTFLNGLQMRFPKKWVMCTIEARTPLDSRYDGTPPKGAGEYANDYVAINKYCDRVRIRAYDQGAIDVKLNKAANQNPYVPVADVRWVEKAMREALKHIPKHKLSIGVPTYGYEYQVTPLSESGYRYDRLWAFNQRYAYDLITQYQVNVARNVAGEMSFTYIPSLLPQATLATEASAHGNFSTAIGAVNQSAPTPAVAGASTPTFNIVWWSDARAIEDKMKLAKKLGVRGISIFKIDGGEDPALWDMLPKVR